MKSDSAVVHRRFFVIDFCVAIFSITLFLLCIHHFQYRTILADDDLYRMLRGLLDGACSGTGFASELHYGKAFSFGYIFALYKLVDQHILQDPQSLIALMNQIGFWSSAAGSICFWGALWLLYDIRRATIAIVPFLFSPIFLEQGTSAHASLISFAFFAAAAVLLFLPAKGVSVLFCSGVGALLLIISLVMRADIILGFPFLALAMADYRSRKRLIQSVALRAVSPVFAVIVFFLLKHFYVDSSINHADSVSGLIGTFSRLSHFPLGLGACFLGCGFFTVLLGAWGGVRIFLAAISAQPDSEYHAQLLHDVAAPLALTLIPLAFWLFNPFPARHFFLSLAGFSILIALLVTSIPLPRWIGSIYGLSIVIVLANHFFAALSGPVIVKHYHFAMLAIPGQPLIMPHVPIGTFLSYHRAIQAEMLNADAFAKRTTEICDAKVIVFTDHQPQVSTHIYGTHFHWKVKTGHFHEFPTLTAQDGDRIIVFMSTHEGFPADPVAEVLSDLSWQEYSLMHDPSTYSAYDKTAIPSDRAAHLGCNLPAAP